MADRDAKEVNVDDFWPAQVAQMKWNGQLYALPYDFSNMAIYYNKKMFDDAKVAYPANDNWKWDEVLQTGLKFVKKEGNQIKNYGLNMGFSNWIFHGVMFGWGGKIWSDDFKTTLVNSKENLDCFKWFIDARKQGLYPEAGAMPQGVNPFGGQLVPMVPRWLMGNQHAARCDQGQVRLRCGRHAQIARRGVVSQRSGRRVGHRQEQQGPGSGLDLQQVPDEHRLHQCADLRPAAQHPGPQELGAALERDRSQRWYAAQERRRLRQADAGSCGARRIRPTGRTTAPPGTT